jgi:predicted phosphate transport protein (TIGR00153 family)
LRSFFLNRKENGILDGVGEHLDVCKEAVTEFTKLVPLVGEGDDAAAARCYQNVLDLETKANGIHRALNVKVAQGAFFGGIRQDILALMKTIDSIADAAKDSGRLLTLGRVKDKDARDLLRSADMAKFLEALIAAVSSLQELIRALDSDKKAVLSKVQAVEEAEGVADEAKLPILKGLFEENKQISPVMVIELRDFVFAADDIADISEDAGDVVLVLVAKGYG